MSTTYIFGHKNPDTDAVTSAIALSYLKNKLGMITEPRILSDINKETEYVLKRWKVKKPEILEDVKVQISDINYKKGLMLDEHTSIYDTYNYMLKNEVSGIPLVTSKNKLIGYVSLKEITTYLINNTDELNTSLQNIISILNAKAVLTIDENIIGKVISPSYLDEQNIEKKIIKNNIIVVSGNHKNSIDYAINNKAKLIIISNYKRLSRSDLLTLKQNKINVIKTEKSILEIYKIICCSNYIKNILTNETPIVFKLTDYITDFYEINNKYKHSNYPIVDRKNICKGLLRILDIDSYQKKNVILVDHNDNKQSVTGLNEASIIEVIDHHALGNLTTNNPISFRNMSVGSANTIIYFLYKESKVRITSYIAGIMLSGLLSDTLILKSPTTTDTDRFVAIELAKLAKVNINKYGLSMLKAGSSLEGLSIEEIVFYDYKEYQKNNISFGIGQILTLDYEQIIKRKKEFISFLDKTCEMKNYQLMVLFITDAVNNGSYILYSSNAKQKMALAFDKENMEEGCYLEGIISRKKQILPNIMDEL